ncbi:cation transporting ATPase C-terminal domain-containing protein [Corallococcus sp. EGB]|uniref:P-type ATPase n=1 Tax=Corallococcus sp. EGB TaxID=1521117 RepID=UPI001CBEBE57|nr:cation transporting ATPase C-terminal domain-containing protein [Corallococcus sp. EGB]
MRGLGAEEVLARRTHYGRNDVRGRPPRSALQSLREALGDPMLWFLVGTSALYFGLGERVDGAVMLLALVPLLGMDVFLHHRTQASTEGLRGRLAERATVLRDGREDEVPAEDVVPGDLMRVEAGGTFPADGLVVQGLGLQAEESSLPGESLPVRKRLLERLPPGAEPAVDGVHWGLAGTRSAREASSIVLLNDDFGTLVRAIAEGRQLFSNLQRCFLYLLLIHIVWLELIIHPSAMLAFQAAARPGRLTPLGARAAARIFSPREWALLTGVGGLMACGLVWAWARCLSEGHDVQRARAVAMASLTLASATFVAVLTGLRTRTARWGCALSLGLSVLLLQVPALAALVELHPPHARDWGRVLVAVAVALVPLLVAGPHARGGLFRGHRLRAGRSAPRAGTS